MKNMKLKDWHIFLFLCAATILTRILFASDLLYFNDSVIYSLAMEKFDLAGGTPPAPGYIGYVALGRLINFFVKDANRSLVWIGILMSSFAAGTAYLIGKNMYSRSIGLITALLLISSPLVWFFGEIAISSITNLFFGALVAFLCFKIIMTKKERYIILSGIALGIGAAMRQDLLIFMFPLWLFSLKDCSKKKIFTGLLTVLAVCQIWFIPTAVSCGGIKEYLSLCHKRIFGPAGHASYVTAKNIFKEYIKGYTITLVTATFLGFIPFIYYLGRFFTPLNIMKNRRVQFIIIWILPSFIYINLVGGGRGYYFAHLIAIFLYVAAAIRGIGRDVMETGLRRTGKIIPYALIISIVIVNICVFTYDSNPEGTWEWYSWYKANDIKKRDELLGSKINYIRNNYNPQDTIIFSGGPQQTYFMATYYLPQFTIYQPSAVFWKSESSYMSLGRARRYKEINTDPYFEIPTGIKKIVFFDEDIIRYYKNELVEKIGVGKGYHLFCVRVKGGDKIETKLHSFNIERNFNINTLGK
jgi:hypothetical protein